MRAKQKKIHRPMSQAPQPISERPSAPKVLVGMSGGIDSTMAALQLQNQGLQVFGLTLKTWNTSSKVQSGIIEKAQQVAQQLNIPHYVTDVEKPFEREVVDYFCHEYLQGRTPNPCHRCNPVIKWHYLISKANELGCPYIATGHYVRKIKEEGLWYLLRGVDPIKDQSYFLWNISQDVLARALFPLGDMTKETVKEMAASMGLKSQSNQQESMGVCFLSGMDYRTFLRNKQKQGAIQIVPGDIVNEQGVILGRHQGIAEFTIGQKRNLNLNDKGYFVKSIDPILNRLVVSKTASLEASSIYLSDFHLVYPLAAQESLTIEVRVRGLDRVPTLPGRLTREGTGLRVELQKAAWALTPGQSMVFYIGDKVIGGGIL